LEILRQFLLRTIGYGPFAGKCSVPFAGKCSVPLSWLPT